MIKVNEDGSFTFEVNIMVQSLLDYCLTETYYDRVEKKMYKVVRKSYYDEDNKIIVINDKIDPYSLDKLRKHLKGHGVEYNDIIVNYYGTYKESK